MKSESSISNCTANDGNMLLPAVYHCKSCGFISTQRKEYTYIKGVMLCVGCKEDYEAGVENVTRWVTSALNGSEQVKNCSIPDVISSFCHHNGTYTTVIDSNGNEVCCKCRKPLAK